jgi:AraC-like DNA-binding protein
MQATDIYISPHLSLLGILNLLGAAQGVLLALALLSANDEKKTANRLLAALILTISIVIGGAVLLSSNYVFVYPHLSRLHHPFAFLGGPLLFLYIRELISVENRFERRDFLHFIPFSLCLIYLLPYFLSGRAEKIQVLSSEYVQPSLGQWFYIRSAFFIVQFLVYLVLIVVTIVQYSRGRKRLNLPRDRAVLFEVRFFVIASLLLWIGALLRYALDRTGKTNLLVPLGASMIVYALGYLKMRRPQGLTISEKPPTKKYEGSTLTPERATTYLSRLQTFMVDKKPYTDGELTIQKLAEQVSIPANHLSQTINERLGQTFSDFVNSYRVDDAKKFLVDPAKRHYSVLAIGEEVGFNSKSSFNSVFKKLVNMTPSEFRKISNGNGSA